MAVERYGDAPEYCNETWFNLWYGPIPDCTRDPWNIWENFCKEAGYEHCSSVAECAAISESCAEKYLPEWQACVQASRSP